MLSEHFFCKDPEDIEEETSAPDPVVKSVSTKVEDDDDDVKYEDDDDKVKDILASMDL